LVKSHDANECPVVVEPVFKSCTAFDGQRLLSAGPLNKVALAVKRASQAGASGPLLVFDDATGHVIDLDLRGSKADIIARLSKTLAAEDGPASPRLSSAPAEPNGRGRPKLGVVGREVTLLPRQWDWLAAQPGGASVTLRKLVEEARRSGASKQKAREAQEAAYRFMSAVAGDLAGYEEATRALFAGNRAAFEQQVAGWPEDVRAFATRLAFGESAPPGN
jgi:uncharacterized protein